MPESLGHILKKIRESKNLSREEVSERTRIPKNIIAAIEEDKPAEIKSPFYAKSFVKTYSGFLGALDEQPVKDYLSRGIQQQKKPETTARPVIKSPPLKERQKPKAKTEIPAVNFPKASRYKHQIIAVIAAVIVFWLLSLALGQVVKFAKKVHDRKQDKPAVVKKEVPKKPEKEKPVEVKKEAVDIKPDQVEISVSAADNTWLQVICDGDILFKGLFKKGSKDTWKAKKEIKFEAGNSGAIQMDVNGKSIGPIGKKGEKKEVTITKDGIK